MKSVFNRPRDRKDLSSRNQGMAKYYFDRVACSSNIVDTPASAGPTHATNTFYGSGKQNFKWDLDSMSYVLPNRCFMKFRVSLTRADGSQLQLIDDVAPNFNMASCFY